MRVDCGCKHTTTHPKFNPDFSQTLLGTSGWGVLNGVESVFRCAQWHFLAVRSKQCVTIMERGNWNSELNKGFAEVWGNPSVLRLGKHAIRNGRRPQKHLGLGYECLLEFFTYFMGWRGQRVRRTIRAWFDWSDISWLVCCMAQSLRCISILY